MAEEDDEDADVEQVRAPHQLPAAQKLARPASPSVLLAVEAHPAADQEHGQAEVGIPAEHDVVEGLAHGDVLTTAARRGAAGACAIPGAGRRPARIFSIRPSLQPLPALGPKLTGSSSQAASSAARSVASGSGSCQQRRYDVVLRLAGRKLHQRAEYGLVGRLALAQPLRQRRENMRRLRQQVIGLGTRPGRQEFQKQRHEIRQFGGVDLKPSRSRTAP